MTTSPAPSYVLSARAPKATALRSTAAQAGNAPHRLDAVLPVLCFALSRDLLLRFRTLPPIATCLQSRDQPDGFLTSGGMPAIRMRSRGSWRALAIPGMAKNILHIEFGVPRDRDACRALGQGQEQSTAQRNQARWVRASHAAGCCRAWPQQSLAHQGLRSQVNSNCAACNRAQTTVGQYRTDLRPPLRASPPTCRARES